MLHVLTEADTVHVPDWVVDLESFRRWLDADDVPEKTPIWFLHDEVWIDMSKEQVFTHALVKTRIAGRLGDLSEDGKRGRYWVDGPRLSNVRANFSVKPDGIFVANESFEQQRVGLIEGMEEGYLELEGAPDMVLEVVSPSTQAKDTVTLRQLYWQAGIREYWVVDARKDPPSFDILRHLARGYVAVRRQQGWLRSAGFGHSFRLVRGTSALGHPDFTLEVR